MSDAVTIRPEAEYKGLFLYFPPARFFPLISVLGFVIELLIAWIIHQFIK